MIYKFIAYFFLTHENTTKIQRNHSNKPMEKNKHSLLGEYLY